MEYKNCRLCFESITSRGKYINIFEPLNEHFKQETISTIIEEFSKIIVTQEDLFSKIICENCHEKVVEFKKFQRQVVETDAKFRRHASNNHRTIFDEIKIEQSDSEKSNITTKKEKPSPAMRRKTKPRQSSERIKITNKTQKVATKIKDEPEDAFCTAVPSDPLPTLEIPGDLMGELEKEQRRLAPKPLHQCEFCGKTLTSKEGLNLHRNLHTGAPLPDMVCQICGKVYHHRNSLFAHRRRHQPPAFQCEQCGAKYYRRPDMVKHIRVVHEGIKAFRCHLCDQSFGSDGTLRNHMRSHTDERLLECTVCGEKFKYLQPAQQHIVKYHASASTTKADVNGMINRLKSMNPFRLGENNKNQAPDEQRN